MRFSPVMQRSSLVCPLLFGLGLLTSCGTRFGAVYPSKPPATPGAPLADPAPSRVTVHLAVSSDALRTLVDQAVPSAGTGTFPFVRGERKYEWSRSPFSLSFSQGRIVLDTHVNARVDLPLATIHVPIDLHVVAEPVINAGYVVKLQSTEVKATSTDKRIKIADAVADVLDRVGKEIDAQLRGFSKDLKPLLEEARARVRRPFEFPVGGAHGCAELRLLGIEAGPTVLADGIEKDLSLILAPQVTLPCTPADDPTSLPPLSNVATLASGPFTITVPIAAAYDELAKAMSATFTEGRYYFSKEFPALYLSDPDVYASEDRLVLKLRIQGPVHKFGLDEDLDGELFLTGRPTLVDNELTIPDLEPTIETRSFLLKLKAMVDGDAIREQARHAMRLNLTERLLAVRTQLADSLAVKSGEACFRGSIDKLEVTGIFPHGDYVRVVAALAGRARIEMPCSKEP